jgi:hypothetical protein
MEKLSLDLLSLLPIEGVEGSQPRLVVTAESVLDRFGEKRWNEWIERLPLGVLHTNHYGGTLFTRHIPHSHKNNMKKFYADSNH